MKRILLRDFIIALQHEQPIQEAIYIVTGSTSAPLSLLSPLCQKLAQNLSLTLAPLSREQFNDHAAQGTQQQMFTPEQLFWLTQAHIDLTARETEQLYNIFKRATAQNRYFVYSPTLDEKKIISPASVLAIILPERCTQADASAVQQLLGIVLPPAKEAVVHEIMRQHERLTIDDVAMLIRYVSLTGVRDLPNARARLSELYQSDSSLFDLSSLFFAGKKKEFFSVWDQLYGNYPPVFWVSFWSDLVWRAYHFIMYQQNSKSAEAKKIGSRLPFNFVQQQWKTTNPERLLQAFHFLYEVDLRLKKSSEFCGLDLFFTRYFA
jgi:hypothetical protein